MRASELGVLVRRRRLALPMTQAELADAAGLHSKAVEKIETGCRSPRPATLRKLADALGVSARDLAEAAQEE